MTDARQPDARFEAEGRPGAGAVLAFGSDWTVSTANPLEEIEVAVGRLVPGDPGGEPFLPDEDRRRIGVELPVREDELEEEEEEVDQLSAPEEEGSCGGE